jgi:thiol-disulfide isomerase/thioredoxin
MKKLFLAVLIFLSHQVIAQTIPAYKAEDVMARVTHPDTLYILNFWATWCGPCVKELPEFDKLFENNKEKPVKILLVSLDFKNDLNYKVPNFIKRRKLQPEVVWLDETNANKFIPKIEEKWQGSIPATLVIFPKNEYRNFFEGTITAQQIQLLIDKQLALQR